MEESLAALLLAHVPLTTLTSTRIHWLRAPQGVGTPYVTLQMISRTPDVSHAGPTGLNAARVQIDCYGLTYTSAKSVARAVEGRLSGYRGTHSGTTFDGVFKDSERDGYDDEASTDKLFRVSMDFIIWHKGT
jgi:hypothetical protein